ncbi:MFS transporter [Paenactinomyces guangxiensis]|uniref:MFS transporter n=1 Tax=Paenactinomyces guangxiensis TaxID=1490290 RepID=A0A7W1WR35_9BACL|nr:MFS transporter [Paenactinomyces guangxiensis]MBA4494532.1 MFS transporter [Paenactinomyces guangxiensis]MBH8591706.1 MFS transporter [Paenactinomyces guangxiensis]
MSLKKLLGSWKYPSILLFGMGVSNIGDWIYLIALNLIVLDMTGSPLAVAALYILKPLAVLFTNVWAGSVIDRSNKRNLMITLDLFRAIFISLLPFFSSIWSMYLAVFLINMASSMFVPTSITYITKLTPPEQRKRFNSLRSLIESGGFLIGPAVAGMLFLIGTPIFAIYINAIALFLSGFVTLFMPNLEKQTFADTTDQKISLELLKSDWKIVLNFSHRHAYIMLIYFLFSCMMVMATAVDSLEAAFAKKVLYLSDSDYGFLVSIAGAGIVAGAIVNTIFTKKLATSVLIGFGSLFVSVGYIIYAFSSSFFVAALGFFVLSFSLAFANTGFLTFYQNNIPVEVMGRVGSIYRLIEAILIMITTVIFGVAAQLISIKFIVIIGTFVMLLITMILCTFNFQPSKKKYYQTAITDSKGF